MATIQIRTAHSSDTEAVVCWFIDDNAARSWGGPAVPNPLTAGWLASELTAPEHLYRTAVDLDGEVVGFYGLRIFKLEARAHVRRLACIPTRLRGGIGRTLLQDASMLALQEGLRRLTLNVYGSNATARLVYERLGWRYADSSAAAEDISGIRYAMEIELQD